MTDTIISFETAKLAKEKGFGLGESDYITSFIAYELNGVLYNNGELKSFVKRKYSNNSNYLGADTINDFEASVINLDNSLDEFILAPTQSLLKKWLREEHAISIKIDDFYTNGKIRYDYNVCKLGSQDDNPEGVFITYEEALEEALQKALNMI